MDQTLKSNNLEPGTKEVKVELMLDQPAFAKSEIVENWKTEPGNFDYEDEELHHAIDIKEEESETIEQSTEDFPAPPGLTRKDIFVLLKNNLKSGAASAYLQIEKFMSEKLQRPFTLSDDVKSAVRVLLSQFNAKWKQVSRHEDDFFKKFSTWLSVFVPLEVIQEASTKSSKSSMGRPSSGFAEASVRTKRQKTEDLRANTNTEELAFATQMSLRAAGRVDAAKVVQDVTLGSPSRDMDQDFDSKPGVNFYGRKVFYGLQEAAEAIENHGLGEMDVVILPPEADILTDEEELDDDNIVDSEKPKDVPGYIEVNFRNGLNDSDEEPLSNHVSKRSRTETTNPEWKKRVPVYNTFKNDVENGANARLQNVKESLLNCSPTEIFEKLFDKDVFQLIADQTVLYARQNNNHDFFVTTEDVKNFFGILLLSGYHKLPHQRMYWSLEEDLGVEIVSKAMSRNRFLEIKKYLHLSDNHNINRKDKLFKLRPLMDILNEKFRQWGIFHTHLSIDDAVVKYYGHHPSKQFIRGKPVRFGFKGWMLCSSTGYCYAFETHCGMNTEEMEQSLGLGADVVLALVRYLDHPTDHIVYFDNYFTTLDLMKRLTSKGIRATGTIRENRQKKCPLQSAKVMEKKERGTYDYRFDTNNEVCIVKWKDNSVCSIATNHDFVEPLNTVKRWSRAQKQTLAVKQPLVFRNYNVGMGGVDLNDQWTNNYRISIRGKKWWWCLFTHMINIAMTNAWKLHQICASRGENLSLLDFTRYVARHYLRLNYKPRKSNPPCQAPSDVRYDNVGHFIQNMKKPLRCTICHSRIRWRCKKCLVSLCIERGCFEKYHTR